MGSYLHHLELKSKGSIGPDEPTQNNKGETFGICLRIRERKKKERKKEASSSHLESSYKHSKQNIQKKEEEEEGDRPFFSFLSGEMFHLSSFAFQTHTKSACLAVCAVLVALVSSRYILPTSPLEVQHLLEYLPQPLAKLHSLYLYANSLSPLFFILLLLLVVSSSTILVHPS